MNVLILQWYDDILFSENNFSQSKIAPIIKYDTSKEIEIGLSWYFGWYFYYYIIWASYRTLKFWKSSIFTVIVSQNL